MPESQHNEIVKVFDGEEAKQQLFTTWLASHPCPSWEDVKYLLKNAVGGEEGERAADEVEETYLKSELDILGLGECLITEWLSPRSGCQLFWII